MLLGSGEDIVAFTVMRSTTCYTLNLPSQPDGALFANSFLQMCLKQAFPLFETAKLN